MTLLLHKPHLIKGEVGSKIPKNLTTMFMDDPYQYLKMAKEIFFDFLSQCETLGKFESFIRSLASFTFLKISVKSIKFYLM